MIQLKEVTKVYTTKHGLKTTALKGVDLTFGDCGLVFVLGQNVCQKMGAEVVGLQAAA